MGKKEHLYSKKLATKEPSPNLHSLSKMYFKENSEQLCAHLQKSKYRSIVLGKSGVLDKRVLQSGAFRFVNVHPAKLPEYRGYAEPAHALLLGKRSEVGFTIHCVEEGIDTGRSIEWVQVKFQKVGSLTELLALVRFQGFKRFLQTTKSASLCFHKKRNQKVSLPILTFLKSGEFAENLIHAFEIL
jgi:folate-dependent phosphoribosylglycinamide formyltransferase PurN